MCTEHEDADIVESLKSVLRCGHLFYVSGRQSLEFTVMVYHSSICGLLFYISITVVPIRLLAVFGFIQFNLSYMDM